MHDWLDTWTGLWLVVADMTHPRWDVQLTATLRATGARTSSRHRPLDRGRQRVGADAVARGAASRLAGDGAG